MFTLDSTELEDGLVNKFTKNWGIILVDSQIYLLMMSRGIRHTNVWGNLTMNYGMEGLNIRTNDSTIFSLKKTVEFV